MRKSAISLVLSTLLLTTGAVYAQQQDPQHQQEKQPNEGANHPQEQNKDAKADSSSQGTKPENMGSTGWTGGTGGSHIGTSNSHTSGQGSTDSGVNSPAAKDQPLTASGEDLKGPAVRFPANKTPE